MSRSPNDPKAGRQMVDSEQSQDGGFLGRWSRRKQLDQSESEPDVGGSDFSVDPAAGDANIPTVVEPALGEADSVVTDEEKHLTDDDMVPIEALNADSDYSPFLSEGVSKKLRNMALKKLFFSGKFAIRDGLDDYDDDFTNFEPLGDIVTSDMKFHQRRKEKARLAKLEEDRLKEEEAQKELAEQQKDEQAQEANDGENASAAVDQESEADQVVPASELPDDAINQDNSSEAILLAGHELHGGIPAINVASDDNIELTSPNAKLKKIAPSPTQEAAGVDQNSPPDETKRDQT